MTREIVNLYNSKEPQQVFDKRIKFCMELYTKSVKGLKFAEKEEKKDLFDLEDKTNEIEMLDDMLDDYDDM
jgi:26S proteasome regulatory subunit N3